MVSEAKRPISLIPVGHVQGGRTEAEDDDWGNSRATIALDPSRFTPDALAGLDEFSHAEIIFLFHRAAEADIEYGARHPRGRSDWPKVGIFAQRGKDRPNLIGLTICEILAVEDLSLHVRGLDAIDGTPVLDIKPAMRGFQPRGEIREPAWAAEIMRDYW